MTNYTTKNKQPKSKRDLIRQLAKLGAEWSEDTFWPNCWNAVGHLPKETQGDIAAKLAEFAADSEAPSYTEASLKKKFRKENNESLDTPIDEEFTLADTIASRFDASIIERLIWKALEVYPNERDAAIWAYSNAGIEQWKIAEHFHLSTRQIQRINAKVQAAVCEHINEKESWYQVYKSEVSRASAHHLPIRPVMSQITREARETLDDYGFDTSCPNAKLNDTGRLCVLAPTTDIEFHLTERQVIVLSEALIHADALAQDGWEVSIYLQDKENGQDSIIITYASPQGTKGRIVPQIDEHNIVVFRTNSTVQKQQAGQTLVYRTETNSCSTCRNCCFNATCNYDLNK